MYKIIKLSTGRKAVKKFFKTYEGARKYAIKIVRKENKSLRDGYKYEGYPRLIDGDLAVRKVA